MLYLCLQGALIKVEQIQIPPPPEVVVVRQTSKNLRSVAGMTKSLLGSGNIGDPEAQSPRTLYVSSITQLVMEKAGDMVSGIIGSATEHALVHSAGGLDEAIASLGRRLSDAGRHILTEKRSEVLQLYYTAIKRVTFAATPLGALGLVRGREPYGWAQYKECKSDVCNYFSEINARNMTSSLVPVALDLIAKHDVMEEWKTLLNKWGQANAKLGEYECSEHMKQQPINIDISQYIFEQTVAQLGQLMAKEEEVIRGAPKGKSRQPVTFELCFSGFPPLDKRLPIEHYKDRNK